MSAQVIQSIIGVALTDSTFCHDLLNGSRRRVLQSFQLSGEELEAIMAIRADSLEGFARQLHEFLLRAEGLRELDPLPVAHVKLVQNLPRTQIPHINPAK